MSTRPLPIFALAAAVLLLALSLSPWSRGQARADHNPYHGLVVCIDPGHGGAEPGAVNTTWNLVERDINLDIALYLRAGIEARGAAVVMTRETDATMSIRQRYTFCNDEQADLLISIHTNSVANPDRDGTLTIYFHRDDRVLAERLHYATDAMLAALSPAASADHTFTDFGLKKDALGVVLKTNMPAAVVEPVMMSSPWEAERLVATIAECGNPLMDACRRVQIAESILAGLDAYMTAGGPGGGDDGAGEGGPDCTTNTRAKACRS